MHDSSRETRHVLLKSSTAICKYAKFAFVSRVGSNFANDRIVALWIKAQLGKCIKRFKKFDPF